MRLGRGTGGFAMGAALGLALALLLVAGGSLLASQGSPTQAASTVSPQARSGQAGAQALNGESVSSGVPERSLPGSALSVLASENVWSLAWTIAPLLVALGVAATVYGVARRRDPSP